MSRSKRLSRFLPSSKHPSQGSNTALSDGQLFLSSHYLLSHGGSAGVWQRILSTGVTSPSEDTPLTPFTLTYKPSLRETVCKRQTFQLWLRLL